MRGRGGKADLTQQGRAEEGRALRPRRRVTERPPRWRARARWPEGGQHNGVGVGVGVRCGSRRPVGGQHERRLPPCGGGEGVGRHLCLARVRLSHMLTAVTRMVVTHMCMRICMRMRMRICICMWMHVHVDAHGMTTREHAWVAAVAAASNTSFATSSTASSFAWKALAKSRGDN
eukprot:scaffold9488_cov50-Phaeocystis_antarctica.AAC.1